MGKYGLNGAREAVFLYVSEQKTELCWASDVPKGMFFSKSKKKFINMKQIDSVARGVAGSEVLREAEEKRGAGAKLAKDSKQFATG